MLNDLIFILNKQKNKKSIRNLIKTSPFYINVAILNESFAKEMHQSEKRNILQIQSKNALTLCKALKCYLKKI